MAFSVWRFRIRILSDRIQERNRVECEKNNDIDHAAADNNPGILAWFSLLSYRCTGQWESDQTGFADKPIVLRWASCKGNDNQGR